MRLMFPMRIGSLYLRLEAGLRLLAYDFHEPSCGAPYLNAMQLLWGAVIGRILDALIKG
jgi:hypothetical protein